LFFSYLESKLLSYFFFVKTNKKTYQNNTWEIKINYQKTLYPNSKIFHFKILGNQGLHLKKTIVIYTYPKWREGRGKL